MVFLALAFLIPHLAFAGKGVIITTNGGGMPGKLIITDLDGMSGGIKGDRTALPGSELTFTYPTELKIGTYVEGTIPPPGSRQSGFVITAILDANPTVVAGSQGGNTVIGANKSVLVTSTGEITGSVTVSGGVLTVLGGQAKGNITIGANSSIICKEGVVTGGSFKIEGGGANSVVAILKSTVNGAFSTAGITYTSLESSTLNGHVKSAGDGYVTVINSIIKDLIVSAVANECSITGNTVTGTTTLDPKCQ